MARQHVRYASIKNFERFQHYKHRSPRWIKLYYSLLDDDAFMTLDEVQQCRLIKLFLVASQVGNHINCDPKYLQKVLRINEMVDLTPLIDAGFVLAKCYRKPSKMLAQSRVEESRVDIYSPRASKQGLNGHAKLSVVGRSPDPTRQEAEHLLEFLNTKTGKGFKPKTRSGTPTQAIELLSRLLHQQYTEKEIRQVIAKQTREWGGNPEMAKYLRPMTLFRKSNFENYVGELGKDEMASS